MLSLLTQEQKETLYLSWLNDFLTTEKFAEYWQIEESLAIDLIAFGRKYL